MLDAVGAIVRAGNDPAAWKTRLLEACLDLVDGDVGIVHEGALGNLITHTHVRRWQSPQQRAAFDQFIQNADHGKAPCVEPGMKALAADGVLVTFRREDLVPDAQWHATEFYKKYYPDIGLDAHLASVHHQPTDERIIGLCVHRLADRPCFTEAERDRLDLFHRNILWIYQWRIAAVHDPTENLTPRLRDVLHCLLGGDSAKQIAQKLRLSVHTVRDYITILHRRFDVQSTPELVSRCLLEQRFSESSSEADSSCE